MKIEELQEKSGKICEHRRTRRLQKNLEKLVKLEELEESGKNGENQSARIFQNRETLRYAT